MIHLPSPDNLCPPPVETNKIQLEQTEGDVEAQGQEDQLRDAERKSTTDCSAVMTFTLKSSNKKSSGPNYNSK